MYGEGQHNLAAAGLLACVFADQTLFPPDNGDRTSSRPGGAGDAAPWACLPHAGGARAKARLGMRAANARPQPLWLLIALP